MASVRLAGWRLSARPSPGIPRSSIRRATDLVIQHRPDPSHTPAPVIKYGPPTGGRSAVSGHTVTVFGCTGFLGRYLVSKLAKQGCQVVIPYRDEDQKRLLKVTGDLGQIVPMEWDARNDEQTLECVKYSDTVYNLVGRDWETRNFSYEDVNVDVASRIASAAAKNSTPRLIHVSHLNASPNSPSRFYRTKWQGERAVRDVFPEATIVRPAVLYGQEDWFLNASTYWPFLFKLNGGRTKVLPVHVIDVAAALELMLNAPVTSVASTFALPGPVPYTLQEILQLVGFFTLKPPSGAISLPKPIALAAATFFNRALWWPTVSPDEVERRYIDDVGTELLSKPHQDLPSGWGESSALPNITGVDGEPIKTWADLQMTPDRLEEHALVYLRRFRTSATFDTPLEMGEFKPPKQYHVLP